jgi:acyl dehydratase/ribonuclease HI
MKPTHKSSGRLFAEPESPSSKLDGAYTANIDGAARGNPGPASYGVVLRRPDGKPLDSIGKYIGRHTNNVAEYYALIAALDYAAANGIKRLRVLSDSQLIVNQIKGLYKVKHPDLRPLHERAKKQAAGLEAFTIQYIPREENRAADAAANAALDSTSSVKPAYGAKPDPAPLPPPASKHVGSHDPPKPPGAAKPGLYLEDLRVGLRFTSGLYEMDEDRMKEFAAEFDPQPFHLDDEAAKRTVFRGLAASGWHTAAATMRLLVTGGMPLAGGMVGLGADIVWPRPTRAGDTLRVQSEITEIVPSRSKPNQAVVTVRCITVNQDGEEVQSLTTKMIVYKRPG